MKLPVISHSRISDRVDPKISYRNARFLYDSGEYEGEYMIRMNGKGKYVWKDGREYKG